MVFEILKKIRPGFRWVAASVLSLLFTFMQLAFVTAATATPDCLPRAVAAALTSLGHHVDARSIARALPMHADGVDLFDLRIWLQTTGYTGLVLTPEPALLRSLAEAGLPLVVVDDGANAGAGPRHAVFIHADVGEPGVAIVVDPLRKLSNRLPWSDATRHLHAALVLFDANKPLPSGVTSMTWAKMRRIDGEFQAYGWLRRAREWPAGAAHDDDRFTLLGRAVAAAPCLAAARWALIAAVSQMKPTSARHETLRTLPVCSPGRS